MKLTRARIRNFRRLEDVTIDFEEGETVFVGPNNSGKTSVADLFSLLLGGGEFSFFDFSASVVGRFNAFGQDADDDGSSLPAIDLDLWLEVDPQQNTFGRVADLLPDMLSDYHEVGVRLRFAVQDIVKLREDYVARMTSTTADLPTKPMAHYLSLPGVLKQHGGVEYYKLEEGTNNSEPIATQLPKGRGKPLLKSLIQVKCVEAQRGLDDHERGGSTLLSNVFTSFYSRHLDQAEASDEASRLIDEHNDNFTGHFGRVFAEFLESLKGLGVPSVNDREPRIISALQSEVALKNNATLAYVDRTNDHILPEKYNGLGVKNLIYITLRVCDHHLHWMQTKEARPACLVVFVEEPEVHLHAQAQQTFIANVWGIVGEAARRNEEPGMLPQLVVTTHSSHILDTVDFDRVRYFQRCRGAADNEIATGLNASRVQDLRIFSIGESGVASSNTTNVKEGEEDTTGKDASSVQSQGSPSPGEGEGLSSSVTAKADEDGEGAEGWGEEETRRFLKRYMKLTHCDLFFADAAVLVEGTAEKLLLPLMIEKSAPGLERSYLTVLEVGGAYAHLFADLMRFLGVPYLVITDIDSVAHVEGKKKPAAVRADCDAATTTNGSLKAFLAVDSVQDLVNLDEESQSLDGGECFVTFQKPSTVDGYTLPMHGRTFEETFIYENFGLFRSGKLPFPHDFENEADHDELYQAVYEAVRSGSLKKTEFALNLAHSKADWLTPEYIASGLKWLERRLRVVEIPQQEEAGHGSVV